jgi:hypothetical protein
VSGPIVQITERPLGLDAVPPVLAPLHVHWERVRGARLMPAREDIDPVELRQVIHYVSLLEVSPPRFVFRIVGANFGRRPGGPRDRQDTAGLRPRAWREMIERHLAEVCRLGRPTLHAVTLTLSDATLSYASLLLPLSKDGATANMLLLGASFDTTANDQFWCQYDDPDEEHA